MGSDLEGEWQGSLNAPILFTHEPFSHVKFIGMDFNCTRLINRTALLLKARYSSSMDMMMCMNVTKHTFNYFTATFLTEPGVTKLVQRTQSSSVTWQSMCEKEEPEEWDFTLFIKKDFHYQESCPWA